jgi:plasmid segregation protein ParM
MRIPVANAFAYRCNYIDETQRRKKIMLFAIDHGNCAIKTINDSFIAGVTEYPVKPPLAEHVIEYGGVFWTLTGSRITYMRDKTKDERYFILTLFAIAKELSARGELVPYADIDLAVGLPPEHFSALKDTFANYFKQSNVSFAYNGTPICLTFRKIFVYPQAFAAVVPQSRLLQNTPRMFVVDIGGYTTDVLLLRGGKPDLEFCRSLELGVITMNNDIIGKVGARHDMKIEDEHISSVIEGRENILPDDVKKTIREAAVRHSDTILNKLRELQVDLRSNPAIFIGGGAALFREYIERSPMVSKADFISYTKANAIGYGMLAAAQLQKISANGGHGESV